MVSNTTEWRGLLHEVIFEADTPAGKAFDVGLLVAICASLVAVSLESVPSVNARFGRELVMVEWFFTILFSIEYVLLQCRVRLQAFNWLVDLVAEYQRHQFDQGPEADCDDNQDDHQADIFFYGVMIHVPLLTLCQPVAVVARAVARIPPRAALSSRRCRP